MLAMMAATSAWLCSATDGGATPLAVGVELASVHLPRVARSSQPWALMHNPFGIGGSKGDPLKFNNPRFRVARCV